MVTLKPVFINHIARALKYNDLQASSYSKQAGNFTDYFECARWCVKGLHMYIAQEDRLQIELIMAVHRFRVGVG